MSGVNDFLSKAAERVRDAFYAHVSAAVATRVATGEPMIWEEFDPMRLNSYERDLLVPLMTDECFAHYMREFLKHGQMEERGEFQTPCSTYQEAVAERYIFQLLRRFEKKLICDYTSAEKLCREVLEQAIDDGLVQKNSLWFGKPNTEWNGSDMAGVVNVVGEFLLERKVKEPEPEEEGWDVSWKDESVELSARDKVLKQYPKSTLEFNPCGSGSYAIASHSLLDHPMGLMLSDGWVENADRAWSSAAELLELMAKEKSETTCDASDVEGNMTPTVESTEAKSKNSE